MQIYRSPYNPIISPKDVKPLRPNFEVIGTFNAAVTRFKDEIILLVRVAERPISPDPDTVLAAIYNPTKNNIILKQFSKKDPKNDFSDPRIIRVSVNNSQKSSASLSVLHQQSQIYLTSISHLRIARSTDGINFKIEDTPALAPANEYETFGIEDARIALIEGTYYINYVGVSPGGATTSLASTEDFKSFQRLGVIFYPDNKDVVLFPERINGKFYALHRPTSAISNRGEIWLAQSPDLRHWGNHRYVMGVRPGYWDEARLGAGAVPIKIEAGWLEIYHGADHNNRYCLGAVLLDKNCPWKVLARTAQPILAPQTDYETKGFFKNTVFSCGLLYEQDNLKIYYGAADTTLCYAQIPLQTVLEQLT